VHFGLGGAKLVDQLEVRWLGGGTNWFTNLAANATWEITEGEPTPRNLVATGATRLASQIRKPEPGRQHSESQRAPVAADKARLVEFWNRQRAAMNAMKVENDYGKAIPLFRAALELDSGHEDSRYYLAHCLAAQGDVSGALTQLEELQRLNPQSHRAFQQWGCLRALSATSDAELAAAETSLQRAHALNPEETGALLVLGEVSLLRGDFSKADERLSAACRSNPKAVGGFFLRGYLAWKRGEAAQAGKLLQETRVALGPDWQPKGSTSEGDVQRKQHTEKSPLARYWESWNGAEVPATTYAGLDARLHAGR
jgi:tetratricopeptide (TPR) repeat protein